MNRIFDIARLFSSVVCLGLFLGLLACSLFSNVPAVDLSSMLVAPSFAHPLGTDNMGRDLLVRLGLAVRQGVLPLWIGVLLGSALGYGLAILVLALDSRIVRQPLGVIMTILGSLPIGIVTFALAVYWERSGLLSVLASLSTLLAVRSYLQLMDWYRHDERLGYWQAHEAVGGSRFSRVMRYGLVGSWRKPLMDSLAFSLMIAVTIEASLSYLGFGIQEPDASFGNILAAHFDLYLKGQWHVLAVIVGSLALTAVFPIAGFSLVKAFVGRREKLA